MKRQAPIQTQKKVLTPQMRGLSLHTAVHNTPEHEILTNVSMETQFDHDFSRVAVQPLISGFGQDNSNLYGPLSPRRSPFGGACYNCPPRVQAKLIIGQQSDKFEQEADRVAEHVIRMPEPQIQRKMCSSCEEENEDMVLTKPDGGVDARVRAIDNPLIQDVLSSPGQPLDAAKRSFMESRSGQDFSLVRVHTDGKAAASALAINARAYTVGHNVVFGEGQYQLGTKMGRRLLAHELSHVVQQGASELSTSISKYLIPKQAESSPKIHRLGVQTTPSIQRELSGDYTVSQLRIYLRELNRSGRINGTDEGDNMARDVVSAWVDDLTFSLTPRLKVLLVRELQDGTVGDDDEEAILALLQHSYNDELPILFGTGGIDVDDLDSDMQGDQQDELDTFYESRFHGGKEAVRRGQIRPRGRQEPLLPTSEEGWNRARIQDCMHQPSGVLPGRIGPVALRHRAGLVSEHFSREELRELEQLIRAHRQARRFVCTHGLPGLLAVSDTRSGNTLDIGAARTRLERGEISGEVSRPFLRRQRRSREMVGEVTEWARRESRPENIPSMASIVGLPGGHRTALERVLQILQSNTTDVGRLSGAFQRAVAAAENTPTRIQEIRDSSYWRHRRFPHEPAHNAATAAEVVVTALREANRYMEMTDLIRQAGELKTSLETLPGDYLGELDADQRYEARDQLRTLKQNARTLLAQIRERAQRVPSARSFERVRFLLTYFLAMNDPDRADASTAEQRQAFAASIDDFSGDLEAVFGIGGLEIRSPVELLEVLGRRLGSQMAVRNQMEHQLNEDPGAVPEMGTVRAYFQSLNGQDLAAIERAYERYAGAYFEHRILTSQADLEVDEFSDLFNRPIGIGGTRRLVCTGFARLGAQLMVDAGANLLRYRIRFHYTPAEVAAQSFSDGHAVAELTLGGSHIWVSNQYIFHNIDEAMDVAWINPGALAVEGVGATLEAATGNLNFPNN